MSLRKFSGRSLTSRLGRTILTILSIVIGVSAVVSVSVMTETTRNAQKMMFQTVTGKATLEITIPGNSGFDGGILETVRQTPGVAMAVPLVERPTKIMKGEQQIKLKVLGIDTKLDPLVRDYIITEGRMAEERTDNEKPYQLVLDDGFARQQGMKLGDVVSMRTTVNKFELELVGLAKPQGGAAMRQMALALLPLADSKRMFNRSHRREMIDSVQIVTAPEANLEQVKAAIAKELLVVRVPSGTIEATAEEVGKEALQTETAAFDEKYQGKKYRITGTVDSVVDTDVHLQVNAMKDGQAVKVIMSLDNSDDLAGIAQGAPLTIDGDFQNRTELGPRFVSCEIVKPTGLTVRAPSASSSLMKKTLLSTEQSLLVSTIYSFVLAVFIILNTFFMSVGERRRQLAIMRAIGATGKQLMYTMLGEALLLGVIGTVIGIPVGLSVAWVMNRTMSKGFDVILPDPQIHWLPILLAAVLGIGVSVLGAFVPAWRAGQVSPVEGLSRVSREDIEGSGRRYLVFGLILVIIGSIIIFLGISGRITIYAPPFGSVFLLVGVVFLSPLVLEPLVSLIAALIHPFTKVEGTMALRQILRHRVRTQLTIGVLFVAACIVVGMTISIKDNVRDMHDWYRASITSDFFVRSLMPDMQEGTAPDLPVEVGEEIRKIPYLKESMIERIRFVGATLKDKTQTEHSVNVVVRDFADPRPPSFDITEGDVNGLREKLFDGQVVVGSVLAHDLKVKLGDEIEIVGVSGPEKVRIAAVANDYLVAGLSVHMQRKTAERILGIEGVDGYAIRMGDRAQLEALRGELATITNKYSLMLQSNTELSWTIDAMKAGVELGMWALVYVAFFVAMIGVVNTLTMNVLEQTRELSMLRIVAMTKAQVRKTILTQALLISTAGLVPGILTGVLVAYFMNLAMVPSFGRSINFHIYPDMLAGALVGAIAITLIAAWFPARRAANVDLSQALHYD